MQLKQRPTLTTLFRLCPKVFGIDQKYCNFSLSSPLLVVTWQIICQIASKSGEVLLAYLQSF